MSNISIALATFNEEENIVRCLSSVKDFASEIVVVDGTSTDQTIALAKQFGARVIVTSNPKIFHINKQKAIDSCHSDWILQMDADEVVSAALGREIQDALKAKDKNGFWIPRKNYFLGKFLMKGGQYPDYTLRLYRKGKGRLPTKDVHEQAEVEGQVGYLRNPLMHYPYKNFLEYLRKWNTYTDLISVQIKKETSKKNMFERLFYGIIYFIIKPVYWFLWTYIRHKGFMDGWQGFVFSAFSALRFPFSYIKYLILNTIF